MSSQQPNQPITLAQFGQMIKAKYPDYASVPDEEIGQRMLQKYPEYADRVAPVQQPAGPSLLDRALSYLPSAKTALEVGGGVVGSLAGPEGIPLGVATGAAVHQLGQRAGVFDGKPPETSTEAARQIYNSANRSCIGRGRRRWAEPCDPRC